MAKIYWFTGQPNSGKTVLAEKLVEFLQTEKRNWRKQVFHIDENDLKDLLVTKKKSKESVINTIKSTQLIVEYLYNNDCDVVVSLVTPYRDIREDFKNKIGEDFEELYVHTTKIDKDSLLFKDYEVPQTNYFDVDTTKDNPIQSFNKIVHFLQESESV